MTNIILTKKEYLNKRGSRESSMLLSTAQYMIHKLLRYNRLEKVEVKKLKYTEEELANKLGITLHELSKYTGVITKSKRRNIDRIDEKLIPLFFNTKFIES